MFRPRRHQVALAVAAAGLSVAGLAAGIDVGIDAVDAPATVATRADRVDPGLGDVVAIFDVQDVDREVVEATFRIAEQAGAAAASARTGSAGMVRIARNGTTVHSAPDGYLIPQVYLAMPEAAIAGVIGRDVSRLLSPGAVVMNQITATMSGAQVGDVIELRAADDSVQPFLVAGIRPHEQSGGSDLVMTTAGAARIGAVEDTRTVIWDIDSRAAVDAQIAAEGLESWDAADPDSTLSTPRVKQALGEPWYLPIDDTNIAMHPTWVATNLTPGRELLNAAIPVRARCHVRVVADLQAAFAEVAAAGLGGAIDVGNTNTFGGCFNPRYSRISGFLSRHAYGEAIDMNTLSNCQGCVPRMDCRVVQIFRRHGFAWGGNFRRPDGMHFEWVGQPRDQIAYPSTYCPNIVTPQSRADADAQAEVGREVLVDGVEMFPEDQTH
jgi:D-alanyl-D-alanine carboxypeptidase